MYPSLANAQQTLAHVRLLMLFTSDATWRTSARKRGSSCQVASASWSSTPAHSSWMAQRRRGGERAVRTDRLPQHPS